MLGEGTWASVSFWQHMLLAVHIDEQVESGSQSRAIGLSIRLRETSMTKIPTSLDELLKIRPECFLLSELLKANPDQRPLPPSGPYKHWQVEVLLNHAVELLERALRASDIADEYWIKQVQLALEIRTDEEVTNYSEVESLSIAEAAKSEAETQVTHWESLSGNCTGMPINEVGHLAAKNIVHETVKYGHSANQPATRNNAAVELVRLTSEHRARTAELIASAARSDLQKEMNTRSKKLRTDKKELAENAGALDYGVRISRLLQKQLVPDLLEAYDRCVAASDGLEKIYGVKPDALPLPGTPYTLADARNFIEELWVWTTSSIRWMARYTQDDQSFTLTHVVGSFRLDTWMAFEIPSASLATHKHVRLRGLSAFVDASKPDPTAVFTVDLAVPESGTYLQASGRFGVEVDQPLPVCRLGRVTVRNANRAPEIGGTISLMNASPIGASGAKWGARVTAANPAALTAKAAELTIELALVGQPLLGSNGFAPSRGNEIGVDNSPPPKLVARRARK